MPAKAKRSDSNGEEAPDKRPRGEAASVLVLVAPYIHKATSAQLLTRLLECHRVLDLMKPRECVLDKAFVEEVLRKEYACSSSADVQLVVACIVADVVRVADPVLPFAESRASDAVRLFAAALQRLRTPKASYTVYATHLLERLAASHAMATLLAKAADVDGDLDSLFETLLHHSQPMSDLAVANAAQVLADAITGTQSVTEAQLELLLKAVLPSHRESQPTGFKVAAATLARKEDTLQAAVSGYIMRTLDDAVDELRTIDLSDGELSERKAALKNIVLACECLSQLCAISVNLVTLAVPAVARCLHSDHNDVRLLVVRSFARIFTTVPTMSVQFTTTYHGFLSKFADPRQLVRQEMIKFAGGALSAHPESDQLWAVLSPALTQRLIDSEEAVRKSALQCICDVANREPRRVPRRLVERVSDRCADKKPGVRTAAITSLTSLYRRDQEHYAWIPDTIFRLAHTEVGVGAVELALSRMLPLSAAGAAAQHAARSLADMPVFDFERQSSGAAARATAGSADGASFVGSFVALCSGLAPANRAVLMQLMEKKSRLRLAVRRLFELRREIQEKRDDTAARDDLANKIRRLLVFLQNVTHAQRDEWHSIFKELRDERCVRSVLTLCSDECKDFHHAIGDVTKNLSGRAKPEIAAFFHDLLLPRLAIPFTTAHVKELVDAVEAERQGTSPNLQTLARLLQALAAVGKMAPQFIADHAARLVAWVRQDADAFARQRGHDEATAAVAHATLAVFELIARTISEGEEPPAPLLQHSKELITAIGRICVQSSSGVVAKRAALCLATLYHKSSNAFQQLLRNILEKLEDALKSSNGDASSAFPPQIIAWLKTLTVITREVPAEAAPFAQQLLDTISDVFLRAAGSANDATGDALDAKSRKLPAPLLEMPCFLASVTDAAAKALAAHVRAQPGNRQPAVLSEVYDVLFQGFKAIGAIGMHTVGASLKRLAIDKQLAKLLLISSRDITKELAAVVLLSAEDNAEVRLAVQRKMAHHVASRHPHPDIRYVSFLLLTAVAEDTRQSYASLKHIVGTIGERLRELQQTLDVSLSELRGVNVFMEYSIPFLVFYLAHHTSYEAESLNNFLGYQRVWHLLFEEVLKHHTNSASFIVEMLRKLKTHDDALAPTSNKTRVMCDLGSKVLLEVMSSKAAGLETVKPFPGSVLLPALFVQTPSTRFPVDRVYLDPTVHVHANVPFKAGAVSATPARAPERDDGGETAGKQQQQQHSSSRHGGGSASARRGGAAPSSDEAPDAPASEIEEAIAAAVADLCNGLTGDEIGAMSWKTTKKKIADAVGQPLDEAMTKAAYTAIRAAHAAAASA